MEAFFYCFVWCEINTCMSKFKNIKDANKTNAWLKSKGIAINQIYVGTAELFQAQSLATTTLRNHGSLLEKNQAAVLNNFLRAARSSKRDKISQAQCFKVLNITKQAQRKLAKLTKRKNTGSH
jgi:hypothetical protein